MSTPIFYPPGMRFPSAQTNRAETDIIYKTTSGAKFRCSPFLDIKKFLCSQCSGESAHVAEAEPLQPWSRDSGFILDVTPEDVESHHLIADSRCLFRADPVGAGFRMQDSELTKIAQQSEVFCAHVENGHECGMSIMLSELPRHHFNAHSARPHTYNLQPSAPCFGQAWPEDAAANSHLYPKLADCGADSKGRFGFFANAAAPTGRPAVLTNAAAPTGRLAVLTNAAAPTGSSELFGTPALPPTQPESLFGLPKVNVAELTERVAKVTITELAKGVEENGKGIEDNKKGVEDNKKGVEDNKKGVEDNKKGVEDNKKGVEDNKREIEDLKKTVVDMKQQYAVILERNRYLEEILAKRLPSLEQQQFSPCNTGTTRWKLEGFKDAIWAAKNGDYSSFWSDPFYTTEGYKVCAKIYPNGDGDKAKDAVSLYISIMQTKLDEYLVWPFNHAKVYMSVIGSEGQELMQHQFETDQHSASFLKPTGPHNKPTGKPVFIKHQDLDNFMVGPDLLLKITVDPRPLERSDSADRH